MPLTLVAWVGESDLSASEGHREGEGPICGLVRSRCGLEVGFARVLLLFAGYPPERLQRFAGWLTERVAPVQVETHVTGVQGRQVTEYPVLLGAMRGALRALAERHPGEPHAYHLSPGTPAMTVVSVLLAQTSYPGRTFQSRFDPETKEQQGTEVELEPIWLSVLPELLSAPVRGALKAPTGDLLSRDPAFRAVVRTIETAAAETTAPILIVGESGTGKEALALHAHTMSGQEGAFVPVNCGAIPRELFESEVFGHVAGAFSGAVADRVGACVRADRGTLFLDEVTELPIDQQVKLLRALQPQDGSYGIQPVGAEEHRRVSFRVVAACNRDPRKLVAEGGFRQDLFYRLSTVMARVPPLRRRPDDIEYFVEAGLQPLLHHVFREHGGRHARPFAREALDVLCYGCVWSGNYRALQQALIRLHLTVSSTPVDEDEVKEVLADIELPISPSDASIDELPLSAYRQSVEDVQRRFLARAYAAARGNKEKAARLLGLRSGTVFRNTVMRLGVSLEH